MKVINKTHWRTDHLKQFLLQIANRELETWQVRRLTVEVVYRWGRQRGTSCAGLAVIGGSHAWIKIPLHEIDKIDLALVIAHEFGHISGKTHADMRGCPRYGRVGHYREFYAWTGHLPLEKKEEKPKARVTPPEKAEVKRRHAEKMLKQWTVRRKRAETFEKKWKKRLQYYDRRLAALGSTTPIEVKDATQKLDSQPVSSLVEGNGHKSSNG